MRRFTFSLGLSAVVVTAALFLLHHPSSIHAQATQPSGTPCCRQNVAPRELDFPYYNLTDGFQSTLLLVSDSPEPMDFTLAVRSSQGLMLTTAKTI